MTYTHRRIEDIVERDDEMEISHVRLYSPLPEGFPEHPDSIEWLGYLRYRQADGPLDPADADAILLIQPGNIAGAWAQDGIARSTLRQAAAKGRTVEFWALERRTAALTDTVGITAAGRAGRPDIALDYYYRGLEVDGQVFEGFKTGAQLPFLAELGFKQVVLDLHEVLVRELPDRRVSSAKAFVGGHSGGAQAAAAFGAWDFDGVPGHDLVRGFIALDTPLDCDFGLRTRPVMRWVLGKPIGALSRLAYPRVVRGLRAGLLPRVAGWRWGSEVLHAVRMLGVAAYTTPTDEASVLRELRGLPDTAGVPWGAAVRILFAATWPQALTARPDPLGHRTCEAEFGTVMSTGVTASPLRIGVGTFDGPVRPRTFPLPTTAWRIPGLRAAAWFAFGYEPLVAPRDSATLTGWRSTPGPRQPSDLRALARAAAGGPGTYVESYHSTRFMIDQLFASLAARTGDLAPIRHEAGLRRKPLISLFESHVSAARRLWFMNLGELHIFPYYAHTDIVSGAPRPDGTPEPVGDKLTDFIVRHTTR